MKFHPKQNPRRRSVALFTLLAFLSSSCGGGAAPAGPSASVPVALSASPGAASFEVDGWNMNLLEASDLGLRVEATGNGQTLNLHVQTAGDESIVSVIGRSGPQTQAVDPLTTAALQVVLLTGTALAVYEFAQVCGHYVYFDLRDNRRLTSVTYDGCGPPTVTLVKQRVAGHILKTLALANIRRAGLEQHLEQRLASAFRNLNWASLRPQVDTMQNITLAKIVAEVAIWAWGVGQRVYSAIKDALFEQIEPQTPTPTPPTAPTPRPPTPSPTPGPTSTPTPTPPLQLVITTSSTLPSGRLGTPYRFQLEAANYVPPLSWQALSGSWPFPHALPNSGEISGAPSATGTFTFSVRATDARGGTATRTFTIEISINSTPGPTPTPRATPTPTPTATPTPTSSLRITTPSDLPPGQDGVPYSIYFEGTGGQRPYYWQWVGGWLPGSVSIDSNGLLSGTPSAGPSQFTVRLLDHQGAEQRRTFALQIAPRSTPTPPPTPAPTPSPTPPPTPTPTSTVRPVISGSPSSVPPGGTFVINGSGFTPDSSTWGYYVGGPNNTNHGNFRVSVSGGGGFQFGFNVATRSGSYSVWVVDVSGQQSPTISFTIR